MLTGIKKILFLTGLVVMASLAASAQKLVDEFRYTNAEESMARIDAYFSELLNSPGSHGYIIVYGPNAPKKGEVQAHIRQMPLYFQFRRFPEERLALIDGGYRDSDLVELNFWLVVPGDKFPEPSNTLDLKDVKFQKSVFRRKSLYLCC